MKARKLKEHLEEELDAYDEIDDLDDYDFRKKPELIPLFLNVDVENSREFPIIMHGPEITIDDNEFMPWVLYLTQVYSKARKLVRGHYSIYIYGELMDPHYYATLMYMIRNAHFLNVIDLYINSQGGSIDTMINLLNVLESTEATVRTHIDAQACSAAAIVALCGLNRINKKEDDCMIMGQHSGIMFHNLRFSTMMSDTGLLVQSLNHHQSIYNNMLKTYASNILTQEEIVGITEKGFELSLTADEVRDRLSTAEVNNLFIGGKSTNLLTDR